MIVRARPDIHEAEIKRILHNGVADVVEKSDLLFFNGGSHALEFFLKLLDSKSRVGIQVFTCITVLKAIKNADCVPVFMDISCEYFTSTYEQVLGIINNIDVLVLTHLFGIPNVDYVRIKELCNSKNVIIIDDLTQSYKTSIDKQYLEDISDNYFYSFYFDKPISGGSTGGALKVSNSLRNKAIYKYCRLPKESEFEGKKQLRTLYWMNKLLAPNSYKVDFRIGSWFEKQILALPTWVPFIIIKSLLCKKLNYCVSMIIRPQSPKECMRMSDIQKEYIIYALNNYNNNNMLFSDICKKRNIELPLFFTDKRISTSISKRSIINKKYRSKFSQTEIDIYNWPILITDNENYPNAKYVINNYINIPTWINY